LKDFRQQAHRLADWIADYLENPERFPVLSRARPGEIRDALPPSAPEHGEDFDAIFADFERIILPGITHWNHPGFFAYFAITSSAPGVLAEFLSAALNQQAMLWRTSPAATELEEVSLGWLRQLIGLPGSFEGVIYDTASVSTLHALAAAREAAVPNVRASGLVAGGLKGVRVYCGEHAHSSVDKAVILLGLGHDALTRIPADADFRMQPELLAKAIAADRAAGLLPIAVVATVGSTSSTSIDPVEEIAAICTRERVWLHVDAAYAGVAAMVPGYEWILRGAGQADSIVLNPHKWLFTPFDLSVLYCRRMDVLRQAFALTPEYLKTSEGTAGVKNLMDTGIQLGRRFRALKLWMIMRHFGAEGLRGHLAEHMRLARLFADWVDASDRFERVAPVPFSVVCFRLRGNASPENDVAHQHILDAVNATGEVFLSHTKLDGRYVLRLAIGNLNTAERHVARAWELLNSAAARA
jgi:aromatic-L-amino-acid decarboxylase